MKQVEDEWTHCVIPHLVLESLHWRFSSAWRISFFCFWVVFLLSITSRVEKTGTRTRTTVFLLVLLEHRSWNRTAWCRFRTIRRLFSIFVPWIYVPPFLWIWILKKTTIKKTNKQSSTLLWAFQTKPTWRPGRWFTVTSSRTGGVSSLHSETHRGSGRSVVRRVES